MRILYMISAAALSLVAHTATAGTKYVRFPAGYGKTHVLYTTVDKANKKCGHTFRKFFINRAALAAVKTGIRVATEPLANVEVTFYPGVGHGYTAASNPKSWNEAAAAISWASALSVMDGLRDAPLTVPA